MRILIVAVLLCIAALAGDQAPDAAVLSVQEKIAAAARSRVPAGSTNWIVVIKPGTPAVPVALAATNKNVKQPEPLATFGDFALLTQKWVTASDGSAVVGVVVNQSDRAYKSVVLTVTHYYGKSAAGNSYAFQNDLEPHGRWIFRALILDPVGDHYRVTSITGVPVGWLR
jgi:hypothetical protein